ncbi:hypothetical protein B0H12DRAFT_1287432, partial [Mycena haematopus]
IAWPLHKDDTLFRSGRPTGLNIYAIFIEKSITESFRFRDHHINVGVLYRNQVCCWDMIGLVKLGEQGWMLKPVLFLRNSAGGSKAVADV